MRNNNIYPKDKSSNYNVNCEEVLNFDLVEDNVDDFVIEDNESSEEDDFETDQNLYDHFLNYTENNLEHIQDGDFQVVSLTEFFEYLEYKLENLINEPEDTSGVEDLVHFMSELFKEDPHYGM